MITFSSEVVGENSVATRLTSVQGFLRRRLLEGMREAIESYSASVQGQELSGGVLQSRTGTLRSSMFTSVKDRGSSVVAMAYPKAKYGWMLALGTPKNEVMVIPGDRKGRRSIKSSLRKGKPVREKYAAQAGAAFKRRMIKAKIPKPFMGPAYERMRSTIQRRLMASVDRAVAEANGGA